MYKKPPSPPQSSQQREHEQQQQRQLQYVEEYRVDDEQPLAAPRENVDDLGKPTLSGQPAELQRGFSGGSGSFRMNGESKSFTESGFPAASFFDYSNFQRTTYRSLVDVQRRQATTDDATFHNMASTFMLSDEAYAKDSLSFFDAGLMEKSAFSQPALLSGKTYPYQEKSFGMDMFSTPFGSEYAAQCMPPAYPVAPPKAFGGYLEPFYHFFSSLPATEIMQGLDAVLRSKSVNHSGSSHQDEDFHIDTKVVQSKFKFKCAGFSRHGGASTQFVVRVFSLDGDESKFAVEFQRRMGDNILFVKIYRACVADLCQQGVIDSEEQASMTGNTNQETQSLVAPSLSTSDLPSSLRQTSESEFANKKEAVVCLKQMMNSCFVDVQLQAAVALVDMTAESNVEQAMIEGGAIEAFILACRSANKNVARSGLSGLANLMAKSDEAIRRALMDDPVEAISRFCTSDEAQTQREAFRALRLLCEYAGVSALKISTNQSLQERLGLLSLSHKALAPSDLTARRHAEAMLVALGY